MSRPLRVLLIEDRVDDAALLLRELRRAGYDPASERVDTMPALRNALESSWDLILCDFRMPTLDALTALDVVRRQQIDTPFIIVSGTVGEEHAVAALRSGAQDFVLKQKLTRLVPAIERELRDSEMRIKHAQAESTLRATEASFRAAFELIPDGVLVCRDHLVLHANRSAATLLGAATQNDLVERSILDFFVPSVRESVRERLHEMQGAFSGQKPFGELSMVRVDERVVHVEITAMSVLFDGEPAILGVIRDVSERRELVARTMQVDRMLAIGTLAAGVGHEINNPLAYVMANIVYANDQIARAQRRLEASAHRDGSTDDVLTDLSEVMAVLCDVEDGTKRIRDVARDLNTFARNDEELRLVDLRAAADSALRMAAPEVRQRARIVRRYDNVPPIRASASRVSQVLLNLVVNAAHAIDKGAYDHNQITVRIRSEGAKVVVEISDTGCGVSPENRERLFTPFFTTKPVGQGTGLGLSISKRIVNSMGGEIDFESALGRGTTMRVVLPAAVETVCDEAPTPRATSRRGHLLFIDDERLVGMAFQRALSREHDVVVVESAADAFSRLAGGERFDAIFCDVNMPLMTGAEFYEKVQRTLPELSERIVMISGGVPQHPTQSFVEDHGLPLLEKPLDMDQVRNLVSQLLSRSRSMIEVSPSGRAGQEPSGGAPTVDP